MVLGPNYVPGTANWYFGKSGGLLLGTDAGDDVGFKFPNAGGYIALVQAEHVNGSVCVLADSAFVEAAARFDTLIECAGAASQFTDISAFMPNSSISTWDWDFGDPASGPANTSISQDPNHTFDAGGLYEVRLTVSAASGCTSTYTTEINIPEGTILPIIPPANSCENTSVAFEAMPGSDIIDLSWNFDDPGSGSANTASGNLVYHAFPAGMYSIDLTTTNSRGCVATSSAAFNTSPNLLSGDITPMAPAPICEGGSIVLTAPAGGVSYFWSDSLTTSNTLTASIENSYSVTLTDANGCTYSPNPVQVDINPGPAGLIKAILENDLGQVIGTAYDLLEVCEGEDVVLVAQGIGSYQYTWSNGETGNSITFRDEHGDLLSVGPHQFTVTITDPATGCTSVSTPFTVNVNPVPGGFFIQQTNSPACAGTVNTLEYNGPIQANWQYVWNNGIADTTLTTTQPGTYFIRVTNEFGCAATSNEVQVLPGPNVFALPSGCHTRCRPDTLCFPTLPGIVSWQWFQDGNPVPGATSSEFVATQSGTYWAELTDIYGCSAQSESLNLDLYDGYGDILGNVWSDVNNNGIIDGPDTLLSGIPIELLENAIQVGTDVSGTSGGFAFTNVGANNYTVAIDVPGLPMGWTVVIGSSAIDILGCDDLEQTEFLLHFSCTAAPNNIQLAACAGDSIQYNGAWLQAGSMQDFNFTTAAGCDSLVTVSVASLNPTSNTLNVSACPGTSYDYNGTLIPAGQSQDFTLTNYLGCDSVLTVQVAPLATSTGTLDVSVCPGASYDYNGTMIPAGQSQDFTLTNYLGCDSVLTVQVGSYNTETSTLQVGACLGENYDYYGTLIPAGQSQDFMLQTFHGCDSVVTVDVAAFQAYADAEQVSICPGTTYEFMGQELLPGAIETFHFQTQEGCDSSITIEVLAYPDLDFEVNTGISCPNAATGSIEVQIVLGNSAPYQYSVDGGTFQGAVLFENLDGGTHTVVVQDANNCSFELDTFINSSLPLSVFLEDGVLACEDPEITLTPLISGDTQDLDILWSTGDTSISTTILDAGPVWVEVSNQCEQVMEEAVVNWADLPAHGLVYVPNAFRPASNMLENHHFRAYLTEGVDLISYQFQVYDRWGNKLFETRDISTGWTGPFRAEDMQPGVFVWILEAEVQFCGRNKTIRMEGDVTLVR
ncbi:MAG: PKD domain-containing protein [Saprospiraceae bacterium]